MSAAPCALGAGRSPGSPILPAPRTTRQLPATAPSSKGEGKPTLWGFGEGCALPSQDMGSRVRAAVASSAGAWWV